MSIIGTTLSMRASEERLLSLNCLINHRSITQLAIYIASAIMGALALKNGFNAHTHAYNALRTHFGNFYSWPLRPGDLWPCSLYDHAEILHAFQDI